MLQVAADANRAALEMQLHDKITDLQQSEARLASKTEATAALEQEILRLTERQSNYDGLQSTYDGQVESLQTSLANAEVSLSTLASGNANSYVI